MAKETKDYTVRDVLEGLDADNTKTVFEVRRRFPAIEMTPAPAILLALVGDKPAFVIEKKLRDTYYSEDAQPKVEEKPKEKPKEAAKATKPVKTAKPVDEPAAKAKPAKAKPTPADDIDALIAEIDGEGDAAAAVDDPDSDDDD